MNSYFNFVIGSIMTATTAVVADSTSVVTSEPLVNPEVLISIISLVGGLISTVVVNLLKKWLKIPERDRK